MPNHSTPPGNPPGSPSNNLSESVRTELGRQLVAAGFDAAQVELPERESSASGSVVVRLAAGDAAVLADLLRRVARQREVRRA